VVKGESLAVEFEEKEGESGLGGGGRSAPPVRQQNPLSSASTALKTAIPRIWIAKIALCMIL